MVAISPSSKAKKLMADLEELDGKIQTNLDILKKNNVDMETPLVDSEGYPSDAIDVYEVRNARHDINCLRNDRKKLMADIEEALQQVHQLEGTSSSEQNPEPESVHRTSNKPFAKVDSVETNSPGEKAGLKADDLIIQFGTLHAGNFKGFQQLKQCVQDSVDSMIKLTVYRPESPTSSHVFRLELCPQRWEGAGVLGCTFSAIKST